MRLRVGVPECRLGGQGWRVGGDGQVDKVWMSETQGTNGEWKIIQALARKGGRRVRRRVRERVREGTEGK